MSVHNLVDAIITGDSVEIQTQFESEMMSRIAARMDEKRQQVARSLFQANEQFDEEVELDEEQLDEIGDTPAGREKLRAVAQRARNKMNAWSKDPSSGYSSAPASVNKAVGAGVSADNRLRGFGPDMMKKNTVMARDALRKQLGVAEEVEAEMADSYEPEGTQIQEQAQHKVSVTVSDPNHPAVSKRKQTMEKRVVVSAADKDEARNKAAAFYKKKGYKVHDTEYYYSIVPKSTMRTEEVEQLDERDELGDRGGTGSLYWSSKVKRAHDPDGKRTRLEPQNTATPYRVASAKPEYTKSKIMARKAAGGITGPKGKLPEEVDLDEAAPAAKPAKPASHEVHVSSVGGGKYKVHAVGSKWASGIKPGEHLTDTELDDFSEMGGKIKHLK